jgi:hypothetical protein
MPETSRIATFQTLVHSLILGEATLQVASPAYRDKMLQGPPELKRGGTNQRLIHPDGRVERRGQWVAIAREMR